MIFLSRSRISAFLSPIGNYLEYAACRTNWVAADFFFLLLFAKSFVIFLRAGRFEGEGVGATFV